MADVQTDNINIVDYPYHPDNIGNSFDLILSYILIPKGCYKHSILIKKDNNETIIDYNITSYNVYVDTENNYEYSFSGGGNIENTNDINDCRGKTNIPNNYFQTHNDIEMNISNLTINSVKSPIIKNI